MRRLAAWISGSLLAMAGASAMACERLTPLEDNKAAELIDTLSKPGNSVRRVAAFRELSCAEMPELRREAVELGFKSDDRMLRSVTLAVVLMAREGVRVDLVEDNKTDAASKAFIKQSGGSIAYQFKNRDPSKNCINFSNGQEACFRDTVFMIDGQTVRLTDRSRHPSITAEFTLQPDNTLKGKLRREGNQPLDAKIELLQ